MEKQKQSRTDRTDDLLDILNSRYYKKASLPPMTSQLLNTGQLSETGSSFTNRIIDSRGQNRKPTYLEPIKGMKNEDNRSATATIPTEDSIMHKADKVFVAAPTLSTQSKLSDSEKKKNNLLAALNFANTQKNYASEQSRTPVDSVGQSRSLSSQKTTGIRPRQKYDEEIVIEESRFKFDRTNPEDAEGDEENPLDDPEEDTKYETVFATKPKHVSKKPSLNSEYKNLSLSKDYYPQEDEFGEIPRGSNDSRFHEGRSRSKAGSSYAKPKNFFIRKVRGNQPVTKRPLRSFATQEVLNLVPEITPDINKREEFRPDMTDNRLMNSKHVLFKTFNRYLTNPTSFQAKPAISDLVNLNATFEDVNMVKQL